MNRPISTLDLPNSLITELTKKGFLYVEDLLNARDNILEKFNLQKSEICKQLQLSGAVALDVLQEEQKEKISICCSDLDCMIEHGIHYGVITELSGAPFTGKTQICMQLCISVQLSKRYGGLNGRAIYIDTRSSISTSRFKELVNGYNKYYKDLKLQEDETLMNIQRLTPTSLEDFLDAIEYLKETVRLKYNNKLLRLIVIDSLSMPILCNIDDPLKRPIFYLRILNDLHKLTLKYDVAVVITNEWITQLDKNGQLSHAAAGGQYVADYVFAKLQTMRINDNKFAIRFLKSPTMPETHVTFMVTQDGIRNAF